MRLPIQLTLLSLLISQGTIAKPPIMTPADTPVLGELDAFIINTIYNSKDVEASLANVQNNAQFKALIKKHDLRLFGGPMLGCVTPTSAKIWVRTSTPSKVELIVSADPTLASPPRSAAVNTTAKNDYTATLNITGLKPFTTYHYDVLVNGRSALKKPLPKFKTNPKPNQKIKFSVAFGGGARYVPEKEHM